MARSIIADFEYSIWFSEWDWSHCEGRSITRWGSNNNYTNTSVYNSSDVRLIYTPSQNVTAMMNWYKMRRFRAAMGFRAIVLRALWKWRHGNSVDYGTFDCRCHPYYKNAGYPDINDWSGAYKDISTTTQWYGGGYYAQYGHDIWNTYAARFTADTSVAQYTFFEAMDITDYFSLCLLNNEDLWFEMFQVSNANSLFLGTSANQEKPQVEVYYFFPLEMFPEGNGGNPDVSTLLEIDAAPINLGAYQQGETGTPQRFWLKNFSGSVINHAEVWDDYPEWTAPVADSGNGGSGALAYISVYEACQSQRWEVKFSSGTAYEVKATAYLDNIESFHPSYDADPNWQGTTSGDWDDPDGNVTIPSAAWSGTPVSGDLFVFYTRGNTTDAAWPADSNDQVEMCDDASGSPSGDWRPINAQRTVLTSGVTIDATTKVLTVKNINTSKWTAGTRIFVATADQIDYGEINTVGGATSITVDFDSVSSNVYTAGAIVATTLPFRSVPVTPWMELSAASGVSETYPDRIYCTNPTGEGFQNGDLLLVQKFDDPDTSEELVVDTLTSTYIKTTTNMVNDYVAGDVVIAYGSGYDKPFWIRVVADIGTDEELKEFRLNVIS